MKKSLVFYCWIVGICLCFDNQLVKSKKIVMDHISIEKNNTFEISYSNTSKLIACTVVTPYNGIYTVSHYFRQALHEGGRIFITLEDEYKCITIVKQANENDVGRWMLVVPTNTSNGYVNKNKIYGVHLTEKITRPLSTPLHLYTRKKYIFTLTSISIAVICVIILLTMSICFHIIRRD